MLDTIALEIKPRVHHAQQDINALLLLLHQFNVQLVRTLILYQRLVRHVKLDMSVPAALFPPMTLKTSVRAEGIVMVPPLQLAQRVLIMIILVNLLYLTVLHAPRDITALPAPQH